MNISQTFHFPFVRKFFLELVVVTGSHEANNLHTSGFYYYEARSYYWVTYDFKIPYLW